jgi:hypothetical protein
VLASAPTPHFIPLAGPTSPDCTGSAATPEANPGHLCIYEGSRVNVGVAGFNDPVTGSSGSTVRPWGAEVGARSSAAGDLMERGSWAVTARSRLAAAQFLYPPGQVAPTAFAVVACRRPPLPSAFRVAAGVRVMAPSRTSTPRLRSCWTSLAMLGRDHPLRRGGSRCPATSASDA